VKADAPSQHPSFLALDRHALGVASADTAAHLAGCETCRAHLRDVAPATGVPAWALEIEAPRRPRFAWPWAPRSRKLGWGVAALACAAALWVASGHLAGTPATGTGAGTGAGAYVGTKGGPEIWLYVKRGERIELWNGSDPVHPGDLLRLGVQPDRYRHISVFGGNGAPRAYTRLYDAPVAAGQPTAVPLAWKVDAQPGDETLLVVLGPEAVAPDEVGKILAQGDQGGHWSRRLTLPKAAPRDGAPP
jgi:hypothetical protein